MNACTSGVLKNSDWMRASGREPQQPADLAREVVGHLEAEVDRRDVLAHDLDLAHVADTQAALVRDADEVHVRERVEAHQPRAHRVDRHHVVAREHVVLDHGRHRARPGPVAADRPVGHREQARVDLLLDREQVDERRVDVGVGPVPVLAQEAAEGVLHRSGHRGVDVGLHRRQVHDVAADHDLGHAHLAEDAVQHEQLRARLDPHPAAVGREVVDASAPRSAGRRPRTCSAGRRAPRR